MIGIGLIGAYATQQVLVDRQMPRLPLIPTLSRKRERGRAEPVNRLGASRLVSAESLLPLAGEGGATGRRRTPVFTNGLWRRMRVSRGADRLSANKGLV